MGSIFYNPQNLCLYTLTGSPAANPQQKPDCVPLCFCCIQKLTKQTSCQAQNSVLPANTPGGLGAAPAQQTSIAGSAYCAAKNVGCDLLTGLKALGTASEWTLVIIAVFLIIAIFVYGFATSR